MMCPLIYLPPQDIDYIQIKADADGARSYNYRCGDHAGSTSLPRQVSIPHIKDSRVGFPMCAS